MKKKRSTFWFPTSLVRTITKVIIRFKKKAKVYVQSEEW